MFTVLLILLPATTALSENLSKPVTPNLVAVHPDHRKVQNAAKQLGEGDNKNVALSACDAIIIDKKIKKRKTVDVIEHLLALQAAKKC